MPLASALDRGDIKKGQETLLDKGYYTAPVDGILGPQTCEGIRQYQKSENLPITGHLDAQTAGKPGWEQSQAEAVAKAPAERWERAAKKPATR